MPIMHLKKKIRKKRWNLVRILASYVPNFLWKYLLPVSTHSIFRASELEKIASPKENNLNLDDSNSSFYRFRSHLNNFKQQHLINSTPKKDEEIENAKIVALEKELNEIKKQVAKLLEHHTEQLQSSDYGTLSDQLQRSFVPPAPPPPPPPLPSTPLITVNTPLKIEPKKRNLTPKNGFPCGKELLKDLKKVQLRKVEKSPGGGPLKKPKAAVNDPGEFLEAILKKRFGLIQNSPESSLESASVDTNNSFGSATHLNSFDFQKQIIA